MKNRVKKQSSIELKGNRIVIRYKSKRWATGYTLHSKRKTVQDQQFSNGRLKAAWNREQFEEANLSLLKRKQFIDSLITEAYEKNVDEVSYVEAFLDDTNKQLKELAITKNTLVTKAFHDYLQEVKANSKKITEAKAMDRYRSKLKRLENFSPKAKMGEIDIKWVVSLCEYLASPKTETTEIHDKRKGTSFYMTKTISQTDSTITRFLKDLKSFFRYIEKISDLKLPVEDTQEYIEALS
ncbi:MAG: phage integrase SAM-like domain-containing protein, partial [Ekhidna sp.]|nr:phage integrase SAM-like domain-containing protein [Ekhidna sp.]